MTDTRPALSSYDIYKTAALLLMFIDHIGYYFFLDTAEWLRVIGRCSAPIWLFLIGYAQTREMDVRLVGGAVLIAAMAAITGNDVFPLSILFTMLLIRFALRYGALYALSDAASFLLTAIIVFATTLFIGLALEYGAVAFLIALWGHHCRRKEATIKDKAFSIVLPLTAFALYIIMQRIGFGFDAAETAGMGVLVAITFAALARFTPGNVSVPAYVPGRWVRLVAWSGRRTLSIYVMHILLFRAIALLLQLS